MWLSSYYSFWLADEKRFDEALEYSRIQQRELGHAGVWICASMIQYRIAFANAEHPKERIALRESQKYFEMAHRSYFELPLRYRNYIEFKEGMEICTAMVIVGTWRSSGYESAWQLLKQSQFEFPDSDTLQGLEAEMNRFVDKSLDGSGTIQLKPFAINLANRTTPISNLFEGIAA